MRAIDLKSKINYVDEHKPVEVFIDDKEVTEVITTSHEIYLKNRGGLKWMFNSL